MRLSSHIKVHIKNYSIAIEDECLILGVFIHYFAYELQGHRSKECCEAPVVHLCIVTHALDYIPTIGIMFPPIVNVIVGFQFILLLIFQQF